MIVIRFVIAFFGAALLLSPSPVWAQSKGFLRLPAESNFWANAGAYVEPADGGPLEVDNDYVSGSSGNGYVANAFAARNSALSVMESELSILPNAPSVSITGYSAGSRSTTWPGQYGNANFANSATAVYQFETTDVPPEATFTLNLNSRFSWFGYIGPADMGYGGVSVYKGIVGSGNEVLLYSASYSLVSGDVFIQTPNGFFQDQMINGVYTVTDEVIATGVQDGDYFTVIANQDGHGEEESGMSSTVCDWNVTLTTDQELD